MVDPSIYAAGISGMVGGLLWQGLLPYLLERRKHEQAGEKPPSFAGEYLTTMIISTITGLIAVFMAIETFEKSIASASSIMVSAGLGFAFTYTVLGISNTFVDLKLKKNKIEALEKKAQQESQTSSSTNLEEPT